MAAHKALPRRNFLKLAAAGALAHAVPLHARESMATRLIPGTDERLPVIGLGTADELSACRATAAQGCRRF